MSDPIVSALGESELSSDAALREYCNRARQAFRRLSYELNIAADELQAYLTEVPEAPYQQNTRSSRTRAKVVAGHMRGAADAAQHSAASMVRCWRSFEKQFAPELAPVAKPKKPNFTFGEG